MEAIGSDGSDSVMLPIVNFFFVVVIVLALYSVLF